MKHYVIQHKGYAFWLAYSRIIPVRHDKKNTQVCIVEIWRGMEPVDPSRNPKLEVLLQLSGFGKGEHHAFEDLQQKLEKTSADLGLEELVEGSVEIRNRSISYTPQEPPGTNQQRKNRAGGRKTGARQDSRGGNSRTDSTASRSGNRRRGGNRASGVQENQRRGNRRSGSGRRGGNQAGAGTPAS